VRTLLLLLLLMLSGCAIPMPPGKPVEISPPQLPPVPSEIMVAREPTFLKRLLLFFGS